MIYDVILKRHSNSHRPNVCVFYDEDKETAIKEMDKYRKNHGFTITEKDGRFTIADIVLIERKPTGEVVSETSYCKLFDVFGKRLVQ